MYCAIASVLLATGSFAAAAGTKTSGHGAGSMGTIQGPVAFLWPANRAWSAEHDNTAPCGSASGVANRIKFPLTAGAVSLNIAMDVYDINFAIAYSNNPTTQTEFTQQVVNMIDKMQAGHQCYKLAPFPSSVRAGQNATIQLQYHAKYATENSGNQQSFYACADIQFVETAAFTTNIPCFNVTSEEFAPPASTSTPTVSSNNSTSSNALSTGAIAGISVGTVIGSLAVVGLVAFLVLRKRRSSAASPNHLEAGVALPKNTETASVSSTVHR